MIDTSALSRLSASLRKMPFWVGRETARRVAPVITDLARSTYRSQSDPYGTPWQPGADGKTVDLVQSGAMFDKVRYVAIGTILRVALGVQYARYQIGKRRVFPTQGSPLPLAWQNAIAREANAAIAQEMAAVK
jgi:hypothetical protein